MSQLKADMFELLSDGVFQCEYDEPLTILSCNAAFYKLVGCEGGRGVKTMADVVHADDFSYLHSEIDSSIGEDTPFSYTFRTATDPERWLQMRWRAGVSPSGDRIVTAVLIDATDIHELENERDSANVQLRAIMDNIVGGIGLFEINDGRARALSLNSGYYTMTGYTRDEYLLLKFDVMRNIFPEDLLEFKTKIKNSIKSQTPFEHVYRVRRKDGGTLWQHIRALPIPYAASKHPVMLAVIFDVTKLKETEEALRASSSDMHALMDHIPGGVAMYELNGSVLHPVYVNNGFYELLGFTRSEFLSRDTGNHFDLVHEGDRADLIKAINHSIENDLPCEATLRMTKKDGSVIWVTTRARQVETYKDKPVIFVILMDVTKEHDSCALVFDR